MSNRSTSENSIRRVCLRTRLISVGAAALITVFAFAGFPRSSAQAQSAASGTLRVGWTPPISLDPALYADAPDESLGAAVYNYLYTVNAKAELVPSLAKSSTVSADGLTYTLTLQSGVKFKDGSTFSADDVKFTITRLQDKKLGSPAAGLFSGVTAIDVVDPTTIKFTLKAPSAVFLSSLADFHVAILKNGTKDPTKEFNGTGPFTVTADQVDVTTGATLTANPNYWQAGEPKVATLKFVYNKDVSSLVQALKGGQLDFVARVPIELYSDLQKDPKFTATNVATNLFPLIGLRSDRKPGSDPNVRKAFRLAIDRVALNQTLYAGLAAPGYDFPVGPFYTALYNAPVNFPKRDVAAAKKLLADAGYPNGLTIDLYAPHGEFNSDDLATALQQQLKEAGINVNLHIEDSGIYYADGANNWLDADLAITGYATRADPQTYFTLVYHSADAKTGLGAWNQMHWSDPAADKLIDQAAQETDPAKRAAIYGQLQALFIDHGPSFIPFFRPSLSAQSAKVTGIEVNADPGSTSFAAAVVAQ